jgi:hypothetical protein
MPLKSVSTPSYIKRTRIYVNSSEKIAERSRGPFDYTFRVPEAIQNVVSIELTGWNLSSSLSSSIVGRYNSRLPGTGADVIRSVIPGASTFDIELENETGTYTAVISCDLETALDNLATTGIVYFDETALTDFLFAAYENGIAGASDPVFTAANTTGEFSVDDAGRLFFVAFRSGALTPLRSRMLFKTGPSASDQASRLMGFEPDVDTDRVVSLTTTTGIGSGSNYVTSGIYLYNLQPFRYINVYVDEVSANFEPLARIYLNRISVPEDRQPFNKDYNARLLQEPIRRLDQLSIRLTLEDDKRIADMYDTGHQLTFDVLSVAQETDIPNWVDQKITI